MKVRRWLVVAAGLLLLALGASACGGGEASPGLESGERTVYMAAVEPKGGTNVEDEPFPTEALPEGGAYILKEPDEEGRWEVETYRWMPNEFTVVEGDRVTLEIIGINGSLHEATLEGYDLDFEVTRGHITTAEFVADTPGIFRLVCETHQPSMTGQMVVLPSG
jgi:plastocyanin